MSRLANIIDTRASERTEIRVLGLELGSPPVREGGMEPFRGELDGGVLPLLQPARRNRIRRVFPSFTVMLENEDLGLLRYPLHPDADVIYLRHNKIRGPSNFGLEILFVANGQAQYRIILEDSSDINRLAFNIAPRDRIFADTIWMYSPGFAPSSAYHEVYWCTRHEKMHRIKVRSDHPKHGQLQSQFDILKRQPGFLQCRYVQANPSTIWMYYTF